MATMAAWTWLVYMAGDNNLEGAGRADIREMQAAGSTEQVQIIVQFDTESNRTTRFRVLGTKLKVLAEMPGVDCGDRKVLEDFIRWGIANYPARQYLLDVWNHGGGWENLPPDYDYDAIRAEGKKLSRINRTLFRSTMANIFTRAPEARAIAIDCGSRDYLDNQELQLAIARALPNGEKLDIVGCDACLMNMFEIAYQLKDGAHLLVGSEETEPGDGWPYHQILSGLTQEPAMDRVGLAKLIVTEYERSYAATREPITQSALDLDQIGASARAVDGLAEALTVRLSRCAPAVALAREKTQKFDLPEYIDLGDFCRQILARLPKEKEVTAAARLILKQLAIGQRGSLVIANAAAGRSVARATGVSIYFPRAELYSPDYSGLAYSQKGKWRAFLKKFFQS